MADYYDRCSYGQTSITSTVIQVAMPSAKSVYSSSSDSKVLVDARAAALALGYDYHSYSLDAVRYSSIWSFAGQASVGGRNCWLQTNDPGVLCHEIGHNYGLWHANLWNSPTTIGSGTHQEYSDAFSVMGVGGTNAEFHAYERWLLNWFGGANLQTVTTSGTYRIYAVDVAAPVGSNLFAMRITKDSQRDYWISKRDDFTTNPWTQEGVFLHWDPWFINGVGGSNNGPHLLDTTPGSGPGSRDCPIVVGTTFSDSVAGIHITPVAKTAGGPGVPSAIDVVVNLGTFPGNRAPVVSLAASSTGVDPGASVTFTASASDPDGDQLAYAWDFGADEFGRNRAIQTRSWATSGDRLVTVVVSDMKGGLAQQSLSVRVGTTSTWRIVGRVADSAGGGVIGATVSSGGRSVLSDSDGGYTITLLTAGAYTVTASKPGWTLTNSGFSNPITVGPDASGINFTGTQTTWTVSGRVTDLDRPVVGATVGDGTRSVTTDATGAYSLTEVPEGTAVLTAARSGLTLNPFGWTNPLTVAGNLTGRDFSTPAYEISGTLIGLPETSVGAPTVTIGSRSTVAVLGNSVGGGKAWTYRLAGVPIGQWNLRAKAAGWIFTPTTWSNQVVVSSANLVRDFNAVAGSAHDITGMVAASGSGVTGVVISSGAASGTTDSLGAYAILNLADGAYTLTPAKPGYVFTPATLASTIAGADVGGKDFTAAAAQPGTPGDLNNTGTVTFEDLALFLSSYGKGLGDPGYLSRADLVTAGSSASRVDFEDLAAFLTLYHP